jgi:hypothetical protein
LGEKEPVANSIATTTIWCTPGSILFEMMKGVPAAVVALIIGLVAALIAYRQYSVARAKLKLDLFDKRYTIFLETWTILSETATNGTRQKSYGLGNPFSNFMPQAAFLFGTDVERYLNEAVDKWAELWGIEGNTQPSALAASAARRAELKQWFFKEASEGAKRLFGKYLSFETWR